MSLQNMVSRCTVALATAARKMQALQIRLTAGEVKDDVEHMEPYGYTSNPHPGAEGVAVFPGGDRSHGVVLVVADRRYRLQGLKQGEVALHDDQGACVYLTREGPVVKAGGKPILFTDASKARFECPIESTGKITDLVDSGGKSMDQMRSTYDGHDHDDPHGGKTGKPNQKAGS